MKISMIVYDLSISGGYQKLVLRLSQQLLKKGHSVTVYTLYLDKSKCYPEIIKDIDIVTINYSFIKKSVVYDFFYPIIRFFLYKKLSKKIKPSDVLIIHDEFSILALNFYRYKNTKFVWMLNNQFPNFLSIKSLGDIKFINNNNGIFVSVVILIKKSIFALIIPLIKSGLKKIDKFLTYDSFNAELVTKSIKNGFVEIVYAGADIEEKTNLVKKNIKDSIKLISTGVIFPYRRYEDIITAIYLLKEKDIHCSLDIIGSCEYSSEYVEFLKKIALEYGILDNIIFHGAISESKLDSLYRKADIFLFVNDGFTWGISVFEAMSYKLPTIITNNIGALDLIKDENCSFIVPPRSPDSIFSAIITIKDNPFNTDEMILNYSKVLKKVSWEAYTDRMLYSIESLDKKN